MSEGFYLSRVEPPQWFKAPSNMEAFCFDCGERIRPGQIICDPNDGGENYIHEDCFQSFIEDHMEDAE